MEIIAQEHKNRKDTPTSSKKGRVTAPEMPIGIGIFEMALRCWKFFNYVAIRIFLMLGIVVMLQIMHNAHNNLIVTALFAVVGVSVFIGELLNIYNKVDDLWVSTKR